jgi:ketosteroid isomerase-like protein
VRFISLGITIMFALTAVAASKQVSAQSSSEHDKQDLERLEKVWNEAHERGDADVLQSLWADDLEVDVPKMPAMSKTEVMAFARSGRMKFLRYSTSDINIRVYGDAAVVIGRLQRTRTLNGQELSDDWRFTKVYTRHAETWRVVSLHASEAAKPN